YTSANGRILSESRSGVKRDYVGDALGSTAALLDNTQAQTDTFSYWPYGEQKNRTGANVTPFQFSGTFGYYHDTSTRNYVLARVLRKDLARWQTQDPIHYQSGDVNLFRYAWNDPVSFSDPSGLNPFACAGCAFCIGLGIGGLIGCASDP